MEKESQKAGRMASGESLHRGEWGERWARGNFLQDNCP